LSNGSTQKTIAKRVSRRGIGLHTGSETEIAFCPAAADEGIRFVRLDLPGHPVVHASVDNVSLEDVVLQTAIGEQDVQIQTVEHVLAAIIGLGIDNVTIELTGNEPPVGDGSALPFVETITEAGLVDLGVPRRFIEITRPICMLEDSVEMVAIPAPRLEVTFKIDYDHPAVGIRAASFAIDPETFRERIAPARTFCFLRDVEEIRKKGLIRGGSLENAIVVGDDGIINQDLRFRDEIVRHKVLDVLGDLALLGRPLKAHIIAVRSGHSYNVKFVRKILKEQAAHPPFTDASLPLDADAIRRVLPHRFPFLLVDRIIELDRENRRAVGIKNVTINEPFFQGHWPDRAVMPGVLQIEAMAQVGAVLLSFSPESRGKLAYLVGIDKVKLRKAVVPGDQLRIESTVVKLRGRTGRAVNKITVDGNVVAEAEILFSLLDE
jgi:UDP-3-O-[3-hydroxymyristoyl] N-acetylglucosamine deacetylase/3-hydroxyacyl-[acyl-carrier-protein] dehydratase